MQSSRDPRSIALFKPLGYQRNHRCGYCKSQAGDSSYYAFGTAVQPGHYQELVDRGWRRSGTTYYKPDLTRSCCPHYTIRLDSSAFTPRKDQRQAINRWNQYVLGAEYTRKAALLCPKERKEKRRRKNHFDVLTEVHRAEYDNVKRPIDPATKKHIEPAHKFEVTLESDSFSQSKFNVFLPYQTEIHHDGPRWRKGNFTSFLCKGMGRSTVPSLGAAKKLGSFHQCYRLDGKLIAVGVLDLLPHGVSSVYLFYNPEFGDWEFGKLSALREIALAQECDYRYYYMGYYIHSCVKMRYKGRYTPQYILDPETLSWLPFNDDIRKALDRKPYVSFSREGYGSKVENSLQDDEETHEALPPTDENGNGIAHRTTSSETKGGKDTEEETQFPSGSLFNYRIPGVLSKEQVAAECDLDHWKMLVQGTLVDIQDFVGWEDMDITNPQSLKGIIGELAAALGPSVVKQSAVDLFGAEE